MDSTEADGRKGHVEWAAKYDEPIRTSRPQDSPRHRLRLKKLDSHVELVTNKRDDGKVTSTYTRVLVDEGRTHHVRGSGTGTTKSCGYACSRSSNRSQLRFRCGGHRHWRVAASRRPLRRVLTIH